MAMSRRRKILYGLLLASAILVVIELAAALAAPVPHAALVVSGDRCYFGWGPNERERLERPGLRSEVITDARGFRTGAPAPRSEPRACVLLALGDSFTEGLYVEGAQAWPAVLEGELAARGYSVRAHNGGMRGHSIVHERIAALGRWRDLRPEIIVVEHTSNDLADLYAAAPDCPGPRSTPTDFGPDVPPLILRTNIGRRLQDLGVRAARERAAPPSTLAPEASDAMRARYAQELDALASGAARWGGRTVFVELGTFFCGAAGEDFTGLREAILGSVGGLAYVDAREALWAQGSTLAPLDTHPSPEGHRRTAIQIADVLVAGGLVDRCREGASPRAPQ